jgi:hypothetical protein
MGVAVLIPEYFPLTKAQSKIKISSQNLFFSEAIVESKSAAQKIEQYTAIAIITVCKALEAP